MAFNLSAGVYDRIVDKSFVVNASSMLAGGIVISAKRGPSALNVVTSAREFVETYGLPSQDNPSMYAALRFLNRAGVLTVRRVVNDATAATGSLVSYGGVTEVVKDPSTLVAPADGSQYIVDTAAVGDFAGQDGKIATYDETGDSWTFEDADVALVIEADSEGEWGNTITVEFAEVEGAREGVFAIIVKDNGEVVETFEVSREQGAKNGYGNNIFIEDVINKRSKYIKLQDNPMVSGAYPAGVVALTGGKDDTIAPTAGTIIQAWDEFLSVDDVPAQLLINAGWAVPAIQVKMLEVAELRKDAVAILDVPEDTSKDATDMVEYRKNELKANTYFGGLFGGWITVYDQYNDREVDIPPSGDVAGVFVITQENYERWDAPAGLQRGVIPNALGVSLNMEEGERDLLYVAGVNPVTTIGGTAAVIWGQKTLQKEASSLDRFNVVNTVLWLNQRLKQSLQPFVFEPNTNYVRDNINFMISSFLENIQRRGGLYSWRVDTSESINTPSVIDNNQMMVDVYVQVTKTAEFIRVSTIITPTGVQLT